MSSPENSPSNSLNRSVTGLGSPSSKTYDYLLKFLLVGDSDVGKEELITGLDDGATESPYGISTCGRYYMRKAKRQSETSPITVIPFCRLPNKKTTLGLLSLE